MPAFKDSPWWVAENLTNQNSFRLSNFFSNNAPSGYQTVHAGSQADWDAFQKGLSSGQTVSLHNIDWRVKGGPYKDEATAKAAIPAIQAASPAPGAAQQAVPAIGDVASAITDVWAKLRDGKMWRSLGWLLLGVLLMFLGLILWVGPQAFKATPVGRIAGAFGR
jgi:hypothetical protein